jgi:pSer/pThr/pTyr-binding forkhead associated (FHA) protein
MEKQPRFYKIGRADDNEIIVDHITVSRSHAEIFVDPHENVFLTDRNSKYGTLVNGAKIYEPVILKSGDVIQVGEDQFVDWEHIIFRKPPRKFQVKNSEKPIPSSSQSKIDFKSYLDVIGIYLAILLMLFILYLQNS